MRAAPLCLLSAAVLGGCMLEPEPISDLALEAGSLDPDRLLRNRHITGGADITATEVQALLWAEGSALAEYTEDGRTAAEWIASAGHAADISPLYLVARIETESGLIRSGNLWNLASATGCACPDGVACDPDFAGFGMQTQCAAELMRGYFHDLATVGHTISGWEVGVGRWTLDSCWVVPRNRATAALYTYTPWVGAYAAGCGTSRWGGSSLVAVLYHEFDDSLAAIGDCGLGDGLYCGGNGVDGDPDTLYECIDGVAAPRRVCAGGCKYMPPGQNDRCAAP